MEQVFFFSVHIFSCTVSWVRGGIPERVAAILLTVAAVISTLIVRNQETMFSDIEWGLFATDTILFLALVMLAIYSDRYWPMWLASLQLVSVWMHPAFNFSQNKMAFAYAIASIFWTYPMQFILVSGALRHHRRALSKTKQNI
jgi:urea transporter